VPAGTATKTPTGTEPSQLEPPRNRRRNRNRRNRTVGTETVGTETGPKRKSLVRVGVEPVQKVRNLLKLFVLVNHFP